MLKLGARNTHVDGLGTSLVELGLRQRHIRVSGYPTHEPGLGQLQVRFILLYRAVEQPLLGVEAAQFKVIRCQL